MPRANWGISSDVVDDFDRDAQYKPYTGPMPPNGVYQFQVKQATYVAGGREKHPQLRLGLELVPRDGMKEDRRFKGYYITVFRSIMEKNAFTYTPFLDAIGVTGKDFTSRTIVDENGKISKIGPWKNDGKTLILGQLGDNSYEDKNGEVKTNKDIRWMGALEDEPEPDDEDDEEYDEDEDTDDYDDGDPEDADYDEEDPF